MSYSVYKFHQSKQNMHKLKRGMHYDLQLIGTLIMGPIVFP